MTRETEPTSLLLCGPHGHKVKLWIDAYQFPGHEEFWDSNWLVVSLEAQNENGQWAASDPCLLTWELEWLQRWFDGVADGEMEDRRLSFLEPYIQIVFIEKSGSNNHFAFVLKGRLAQNQKEASVLNVILSDKERNSVNRFFKRTIERFPILSDEKKAERFVRAGPQFIDVDRIGKSVRIEREKLEIMKRELRKHDFDVDTLLKRDWLD